MVGITRRAFLTLTGATLLAAGLPVDLVGLDAADGPPDTQLVGRALRAVDVLAQRVMGAAVVRRLWPDDCLPIRAQRGDWYALEAGFVRAADVQPVLAYDPAMVRLATEFPAWMSVIAPVVPLRAWAAGTAPLVDRVGWGGVLCACDRVDDGRDSWYAVSTHRDGALLGWTLANRWAVVDDVPPATAPDRRLVLDAASSQVTAFQQDRIVLRAPVAVPANHRPGRWQILSRQPGRPGEGPTGAAWIITGGGGLVYGVHWHNDMGHGIRPGAGGWELSPLVARWLYHWLPADAMIEVR